jgi:hypothetical protein
LEDGDPLVHLRRILGYEGIDLGKNSVGIPGACDALLLEQPRCMGE